MKLLIPVALLILSVAIPSLASAGDKVPVILDTDIGFDIDDTWALAMLTQHPELDVKLVLGSHGKNRYRARLIARILDEADRRDIAVGIGPDQGRGDSGRQSAWLGSYQLSDYPGKVHQDGIQAMIDIIMAADDRVTIIAIGPMTNLAMALQREPRIAEKAQVIAVMGSIRRGMFNAPHPQREYNIAVDIKAAQQVLAAPWPVTIAPWDTTGAIQLTGENYEQVRESGRKIAETVIDNYRVWLKPAQIGLLEQESTVLFDTLAIYLATVRHNQREDALVKYEVLPLRITSNGMTVIDPNGRQVLAVTEWNDEREFDRYIRDSLTRKRGFFQRGIFR